MTELKSTDDKIKVFPLEALSEQEMSIVRRLKELSGLPGILLGAVRGGAGISDLRTLLQSPTGTIIIRSFGEEVTEELQNIKATLAAWKNSPLSPETFSWGEDPSNSQIWISRRWYESGYEPKLSEQEFSELVSELISLHNAGFGHGHLVPANLVRESGKIKVLDPCIYFLQNKKDSMSADPRALDLQHLVEIAPPSLQARTQSAVTTGRLSSLISKTPPFQAANSPTSKYSWRGSTPSTTAKTREPNKPLIGWSGPTKGGLIKSVLLASLIGASIFTYRWYTQQREIIPVSDAVQFIASGQPSLMAQVAEAAILGQRSAQALIVKAAQEGKISEALANRKLINLAFDQRWEAQLSSLDREIALRLSLSKLYPDALANPPSLSKIHPGVLLAVIADIDESRPAAFANNISIDGFVTLPDEIGLSFAALKSAGVTSVGDPSARALSRIIGGSASERDIQLVLTGKGAGSRLRALMPLLLRNQKLSRATLSYIAGSSGVLTELLRWLGSDFSVGWSKSPPEIILGILAGNPPASLTIEQWSDLLSFPEVGIKRAAAVSISEKFLKNDVETVTLLAASDIGLSRSQVSTLISALSLPAEQRDTLLSRWFELRPNSEAVKRILLVRGNAQANDTFNLDAARALSSAGTAFSEPELRRMTQFKEPLVRALAYSKLAVDDPAQRKILEECAMQEPDQKLRNGLLERLSEYTRTQAVLSK